MNLQAVIFDCDGILVDTEPLHYQAYQEVFTPLGLGFDYDHYLESYIGFDDREAIVEVYREAGRPLGADQLAALIEAKGKALLQIISRGIATFPGVVECVRGLAAQGVPLAVASGALKHEVLAFVEALGLKGIFPVIVTADEVERSKPDPETYLKALDRLRQSVVPDGLDPRRCVAIEDTPAGIHSAQTAGLTVIAVTNSFPRDHLQNADHILDNLSGLDPTELERIVRAAGAHTR